MHRDRERETVKGVVEVKEKNEGRKGWRESVDEGRGGTYRRFFPPLDHQISPRSDRLICNCFLTDN